MNLIQPKCRKFSEFICPNDETLLHFALLMGFLGGGEQGRGTLTCGGEEVRDLRVSHRSSCKSCWQVVAKMTHCVYFPLQCLKFDES